VFVFNRWGRTDQREGEIRRALYAPGEFDFRPKHEALGSYQALGWISEVCRFGGASSLGVSPTPEGRDCKIKVYLGKAMDGEPIEDIYLEMNDYCSYAPSRMGPLQNSYLVGELRYQGRYTIEKGEKLSRLSACWWLHLRRPTCEVRQFIRESVQTLAADELKDLTTSGTRAFGHSRSESDLH